MKAELKCTDSVPPWSGSRAAACRGAEAQLRLSRRSIYGEAASLLTSSATTVCRSPGLGHVISSNWFLALVQTGAVRGRPPVVRLCRGSVTMAQKPLCLSIYTHTHTRHASSHFLCFIAARCSFTDCTPTKGFECTI